jgi:starvation-inducible DNA-binding protein
MNELTTAIKVLLANATVMYYKAHQFHWNVEGPDFPQYHKFLGKLYEEVYDNAIDKTAELIRQLDSYTPGSITRFAELSQIGDQTKIPRSELMIAELYEDNNKILELWKQAFHVAEQEDQQGIADFIASRIDAHGKHNWMLRSILKKSRA